MYLFSSFLQLKILPLSQSDSFLQLGLTARADCQLSAKLAFQFHHHVSQLFFSDLSARVSLVPKSSKKPPGRVEEGEDASIPLCSRTDVTRVNVEPVSLSARRKVTVIWQVKWANCKI